MTLQWFYNGKQFWTWSIMNWFGNRPDRILAEAIEQWLTHDPRARKSKGQR